jgi:hypothetical protein
MSTLEDSAQRLRQLAAELGHLADRVESGDADRSEFDVLVAALLGTQHDRFGPRPRAARGEGAKARILGYLKARIGEEVHGEELRLVSGIQEWARRVRELRVEDGYEVAQIGRSTYRLESEVPDKARAQQWELANKTRRQPGNARDRIKAFLEANVGQMVTREQIDYVSRIAEGSRRVRELRDEEGWPINSHIDEQALEPGEYRLLSTDPADRRDPLQRLYPDDLRERIFERDAYTCQVCGRDREKAEKAGDTRFYLEVHHKVAIADELEALPLAERNEPANLVTLCHSDHLRETEKLQRGKRARRRSAQAD